MKDSQAKEIKRVEDKAKKYKKLFEKLEVNRNPVSINGKNYYQVVYFNKNGQTKGGAILTSEENVEFEAREVHATLTLYNSLIMTLFDGGMEIASTLDKYYSVPLTLMEESPSPELLEGKQKIERLYELNKEYRSIYTEKITELRSAFIISDQDLMDVVTVSSKLDLLHFEMLEIMTRDIPVMKNWIDEMKKNNLWDKMDSSTQKYYIYMIKNKRLAEDTIKKKPALKGNTYEEILENKIQVSMDKNNKKEKEYRKRLRWPKPW